MHCMSRPINGILRIVFNNLKHRCLSIESCDGNYRLCAGIPDFSTISQAFQDGAIRFEEDGSISFCGEFINPKWDTVRIRRKVEEYLRKSASTSEIIKLADCLGINITN